MKPLTVTYDKRLLPQELRGATPHYAWFEASATGEAGTVIIDRKSITFHMIRQDGMPYLPWFVGYLILPSGERFVFLSDAIPKEFRPFMAWHEVKCRARELPNCEHACYAVMEQEFLHARIHLATEALYEQYVFKRAEHFARLVDYQRRNSGLYPSLPAHEYALEELIRQLAQVKADLHPA